MRASLATQVSISEMRHMEDVEGLSRQEIAKRLDISPATVLKYLGLKNSAASESARLTDDKVRQIIDLRRKRFTTREIAKKVGISPTTAHRYIEQNKDRIYTETTETEEKQPAMEKNTETMMFRVLDEKRTLRLQGSECQYEIVTGGGIDSLTVINGQTEIIIFDRDSLNRFIQELNDLKTRYFGEG